MSNNRLPDTVCSIPDALAYWAERTPDAPALVIPGQPAFTYAALARRTRAIAAALYHSGVGRGGRVVVLVPDGPDLAIALLGVSAAATAIPLAANLTAAELDSALRDLAAVAVVVGPPLTPGIHDCLTRHGLPVISLDADEDPDVLPRSGETQRSPCGEAGPDADDIALVLRTSGTTGGAKLVPATHRWLVGEGRARRDLFGLNQHDRALVVAPLTLSLGTCVLFHSIVAGAALIIPLSSDLPTLVATIDEARPTWMFPSAGLVELLVAYLREQPAPRRSSSLRFVRVTAAPIAVAVCEELAQRLDAPVLNCYSATETGLVATALPPPAMQKSGSVGRPVQDIRIVAADGSDAVPGEEGEIWVRAAKLSRGYLDDPPTNAAVLAPGGWFRTGDIGSLDEAGFLFLAGRLSERINRGGAKISPEEVDAVLLAHPAIEAAAVFAVPDARLGEDIVAAVKRRGDHHPSARDIRAWLLTRLSPLKVPRRIWFVAELPRTALGKVQRAELCRQWLDQQERNAGPGARDR
ncbi:MAG: AMP-binding protein [Thermomicrobiales bacterium]